MSSYDISANGIILNIRTSLKPNSNSSTETWHNNVPNGILLKTSGSNMLYFYSETVLVPTAVNSTLILKNEYSQNDFKTICETSITATQVQVDNTIKLFTNGKENQPNQ